MKSLAVKRGTIAFRTKDGWEGVYNAKNSSPSIFGHSLWTILQQNWKRLDDFAKEVLQYQSWEQYKQDDICIYCGKYKQDSVDVVKSKLYTAVQEGTLAPDPECKEHTHVKLSHIFDKNEHLDGLYVEWVYVIDPKTYNLEIFKSVFTNKKITVKKNGREWQRNCYRYHSIGTYNLLLEEPNWQSVEDKGVTCSQHFYKLAILARV